MFFMATVAAVSSTPRPSVVITGSVHHKLGAARSTRGILFLSSARRQPFTLLYAMAAPAAAAASYTSRLGAAATEFSHHELGATKSTHGSLFFSLARQRLRWPRQRLPLLLPVLTAASSSPLCGDGSNHLFHTLAQCGGYRI